MLAVVVDLCDTHKMKKTGGVSNDGGGRRSFHNDVFTNGEEAAELVELCCDVMSLQREGEADACDFNGFMKKKIFSCMRVAFYGSIYEGLVRS